MDEIKKDPIIEEENKTEARPAQAEVPAGETAPQGETAENVQAEENMQDEPAPAASSKETMEKTQTINLGEAEKSAEQEVNIPQAELERIAEPAHRAQKTKAKKEKERKQPVYEEDDEDDDEDDGYYYYDRPRSRGARAAKVIIITLLLLLFFGALAFGGYVLYRVYFYSQVYDGIWVDGVDYSGMTKREVLAALTEKYSGVPAGQDLEITIGDDVYVFEIAGNISYDTRATAEKIILYGRSGDFSRRVRDIVEAMRFGYEIDMAYSITESGIETQIQRVAAEVEQQVAKATYVFDGTRVLLDRGQCGLSLDKNRLLTFIKNRLYSGDFSPAMFELDKTETNILDIVTIKAEIEIDMREPALDIEKDPTGNTIIPGQIGIYLDLETAEAMLAQSTDRVVEIPVTFIYPTFSDDQFKELLFSYEFSRIDTPLTSNDNRTTNVTLAAAFCNNVILMPGETFSFNRTVGQRTSARGFKEATVYMGATAEDGLGGGICQVSSALYYCALRADLEIVERYAHSRTVTYVPLGQDATVAWGSKDFQFKNNTEWPIKIVTVFDKDNHQVDVSFIGTSLEPNRKIDIETIIVGKTPFSVEYQGEVGLLSGSKQIAGGYTGYKADTYRIEYLDGKEISRTFITKSTYYKYNRVVQVPITDPRAGTTVVDNNQPDDPYEYVEPSPTFTVDPPNVDLPTNHNNPSNPSTPVTPDVPDTPVTPDVPETPVTPDVPDTPVTPDVPDTPVTPDVPDTPVTPDVPDTPVTPDIPTDPTSPSDIAA